MNRILAMVAAVSAVFCCLAIWGAEAQTAQDLVGTWTLVSVVAQRSTNAEPPVTGYPQLWPSAETAWKAIQEKGSGTDSVSFPYGSDPVGVFIFTSDGHYASIGMRRDLPMIASKNRLSQTPDESRAITQGSIAHFGTYSVIAEGKTLVFRIERSTYPNWNGIEQWRPFSLSGDELTYISLAGSMGLPVRVTLRRANISHHEPGFPGGAE